MKKALFLTALLACGLVFNTNANAQGKKIGMKKAREIAAKQTDGKIKSGELEKETANGFIHSTFAIIKARSPKSILMLTPARSSALTKKTRRRKPTKNGRKRWKRKSIEI